MPNLTATATGDLNFDFQFTPPPSLSVEPPILPSASKHTSVYLNRLTSLGFTPFERATIIKLNLEWTICHTEWPAFHWDKDALRDHARDFWAGSGCRDEEFEFNADAYLESRKVCDLEGEEVGALVVGPCMNSTSRFPGSSSNSGLVVPALDPVPNPPVDESSDVVIVNANTAEIVSDDIKGKGIPSYDTHFKNLYSSPPSNPHNNSHIPTNIPLPLSRLDPEDSSSESHTAEFDCNSNSEWSFSASNRPSSSSGYQSDLDTESGSIEKGTELTTLRDCVELDEKLIQLGLTKDLDGDDGSGQNASASDMTLSSEVGSSNTNITLVEGPNKSQIDPTKVSNLTPLLNIPVTRDPSLLLSTGSIPPMFEYKPRDMLTDSLPLFKALTEAQAFPDVLGKRARIWGRIAHRGYPECKPCFIRSLPEYKSGGSLPDLLAECEACFEILEEKLGQPKHHDDVNERLVVYSTSGRNANATPSSEAFPKLTLFEEPVKAPIDPIRLEKLMQLSTIPVAGDPSLLRLMSTRSIPPLPEYKPRDIMKDPLPPSKVVAEAEAFPELVGKILDRTFNRECPKCRHELNDVVGI